jgi:hypothetical protein
MHNTYSQDEQDELKVLLERRSKYFMLSGFERKLWQAEFEKIQRKIISLKLILELYHDELDMLEVIFNYSADPDKSKICQDAEEKGEVKWLKRTYSPWDNYEAKYVAIVRKPLTDPWLAEIFNYQQAKRSGYIDCPWPTKLGQNEED